MDKELYDNIFEIIVNKIEEKKDEIEELKNGSYYENGDEARLEEEVIRLNNIKEKFKKFYYSKGKQNA